MLAKPITRIKGRRRFVVEYTLTPRSITSSVSSSGSPSFGKRNTSSILVVFFCLFFRKKSTNKQPQARKFRCRYLVAVATYLAPVVPLGVDCVVDGLRAELLCTDGNDGVRVRFALAEHADVLFHEVLRLDDMNPKYALW